jgi:nucleotide-binding universal stress UspA family protein
MHTILLATDGSPSAWTASETALELAKATGWRLRVLSVWQLPVFRHEYPTARAAEEVASIERMCARSAAQHVAEVARSRGAQATAEIREGDPVDEICAAARDCEADFVVVGAHGWGPLRRLVFGSVSSALLHHAPCPVLVVRAGAEVSTGAELAGAAAGRAGE